MTTQLMIYKSVVPLSPKSHSDWSVETGSNFAFSSNVNSVPLMTVEFEHAAPEYAIVFAGENETITPVALLGLRNENLYLSSDAHWDAKYRPAFLRRYPFVFSPSKDHTQFTLCIDEGFSGFNHEGRGQKLFNNEHKPTAYVQDVLKFLQDYEFQYRRTQEFCKKLARLNVLDAVHAQVQLPSGQQLSLDGLLVVDRTKLKALQPDQLADLAKSNELEWIYLHLLSMRNFETLLGRLNGRTPDNMEHAPSNDAGS